MTHPFDDALALDLRNGRAVGRTTPDFANMVGPYGGLTAATILEAMSRHPDRVGDPVSLTVNFAAPIADGEFVVDTAIARTNRTNQHWTAQLSQDGDVKTTATAVYGVPRDTWADTEIAPPAAPDPEDCAPQDISSFVVWTRNYDMRFVSGSIPGAGEGPSPDSESTLWVRAHPDRPLDHPGLTAMCDVFYPRVFRRRAAYVPSGTISFTVYFHASAAELERQGADWVLATVRGQRFTGGFFDHTGTLWSRSGELLAVTHQLAYFKN
jgi:acyl-CoA thioesterase